MIQKHGNHSSDEYSGSITLYSPHPLYFTLQFYGKNHRYIFSSTYQKNNNSCSIFHKTKGIPQSIETRKVLLNMSMAILTQIKIHHYCIFFPSSSHSDFENQKPISISFNQKSKKNSYLLVITIQLPILRFPYRKRLDYKLSHFQSKNFTNYTSIPFITNESTLVLQDENQPILFITKRKREIIYSSYSSLPPYFICFLIQCIIFEGFFSFHVSFYSIELTNNQTIYKNSCIIHTFM